MPGKIGSLKKVIYLAFFCILIFPIDLLAQQVPVTGTVRDRSTGELLIGVNVTYAPGKGTVTDIDGKFSLDLEPGAYALEISYVGFEKDTRQVTVKDKPVFLDIQLRNVTLTEVEVIGDVARTRETPVAFTNIPSIKIEEELASQDIPMILNSTPGVYATRQGGGDGDARINIRGFNQRNVAVMLDGIPVNDMENGWVYWSNWFGLDMVMRYTQVQRGLGASKLAIPSVGGTINIATKGVDEKRMLTVKQEVANAGYLRTSFGFTSGRMKKGWGVTLAGSFKRGNGWVDQTWTKGWFYFLRVDKELGNHLLSFSAMGAPQEHGQRSYKRHIATYDEDFARKAGMTGEWIDSLRTLGLPIDMGMRYNPNWGYLERVTIEGNDTLYPGREPYSLAYNFYHKPLFSLRDFWRVNQKLYISNILYLSVGTGGGASFSSTPPFDQETHQPNIQNYYISNANLRPNGINYTHLSSEFLRNAINNHFWYGLLSTFDYQLNDEFSFSGGLDLRSYKGEHYREVADLLGGKYCLDDGNKNESDTIRKYEGDKIGYYNDALVRWGGLFAQVKYQRGNFTAFLNLTGSYSAYKRIDHFIKKTLTIGDTTYRIGYGDQVIVNGVTYDWRSPELKTNQTDWKYLPGFTVKGGVNYNLTETMNIFVNLGYLSKAQRFNNVYDYNNNLFGNIENEKVRAIEAGYSIYKPRYTFNVNGYYTEWKNKPSDRGLSYTDIETGQTYRVNINDMDARHMGVEFEFSINLLDNLNFESLLSIGDWQWTSADTARVYDDDGQFIRAVPFDAKGLYVGDAAQIQNRESLRWEIIRDLYVTGVFTWFTRHYSDFNPFDYEKTQDNEGSFDPDGAPRQSWKIPGYYLFDLHAGYSFMVNKVRLHVRGSVLNVLDQKYITDAQNNDEYLLRDDEQFNANSAGVFVGLGRLFNVSLQMTF
jgi:hypothetical protein